MAEKNILLGDFNAQIGSREFGIDTDDPWWVVRGPHGFAWDAELVGQGTSQFLFQQ